MSRKHSNDYTDEELLQPFKDFYKERGRNICKNEISTNNFPFSLSTYIRRFGNQTKIAELCGHTNKVQSYAYTDEELLQPFKDFYIKYGRGIFHSEIPKNKSFIFGRYT